MPPSERLLAAVEAFYSPPSHDRPRNRYGAAGDQALGLVMGGEAPVPSPGPSSSVCFTRKTPNCRTFHPGRCEAQVRKCG